MKKIFIITILLLFIFSFEFVLSQTCPIGAYIDDVDGRCLDEDDISRREAINMNNVLKIVDYFDFVRTNVITNFYYLSSTVKNEMTDNLLDVYYDKNYNISTTTIEQNVPRSGRDLYFKSAYTPYISISKLINIFEKYDKLGYSIQSLVELLNSTITYIEHSDINISQFITDITATETQLQGYKNSIDSDIGSIYNTMLTFNFDNQGTFENFINLYISNSETFNSRNLEYNLVKDQIIDLAVDAIRAVEVASNGNSSISASPNIIYNDETSVSKITITIKDSVNNPITNRQVNLICDQSNVIISPASANTNSSGVALFDVSSRMIGFINLKVTVENDDMVILGNSIIESKSILSKICADGGGTWNGTNCICQSGFTWTGTQCVNSTQIACQNSGGTWNGTTCICQTGFTWTGTQCVNSTQIACQNSGGEWNGENCKCPENHYWDEKTLSCVKSDIVIEITEEMCIAGGGEWDGENCKCPENHYWDEKTLSCVKSDIVIEITEEMCIAGGGEWNGENCKCPENHYWDEKTLSCVKSDIVIEITEEMCIAGGGEWDGENCKCPENHYWDEKEFQCIKK